MELVFRVRGENATRGVGERTLVGGLGSTGGVLAWKRLLKLSGQGTHLAPKS